MAKRKDKKNRKAKPEKAPPPEKVGTSIWQMHGGLNGCKQFTTRATATHKSRPDAETSVTTRYRFCLTCQRPYCHHTVLKKGPHCWVESGSAFGENGPDHRDKRGGTP